jgi:hypothetical protein
MVLLMLLLLGQDEFRSPVRKADDSGTLQDWGTEGQHRREISKPLAARTISAFQRACLAPGSARRSFLGHGILGLELGTAA